MINKGHLERKLLQIGVSLNSVLYSLSSKRVLVPEIFRILGSILGKVLVWEKHIMAKPSGEVISKVTLAGRCSKKRPWWITTGNEVLSEYGRGQDEIHYFFEQIMGLN